MKEYPSIRTFKKTPKVNCIAFDKLDGSNIRFKWNRKKGITLFGTRTQLIDQSAPFWGEVVNLIRNNYEEELHKILSKNYNNEQIIVFGEFYGNDSFAGTHNEDQKHTWKFVPFDVYNEKSQKFLLPQEFIKLFSDKVETPRVVYTGNINQSLFDSVRNNQFDLNEGVICKGTVRDGSFAGGVVMCKIKTRNYLDKLKSKNLIKTDDEE